MKTNTIVGIAAPTGGLTISLATTIAWLQIASLVVGLAVGLFALRRAWRNRNK